MKIEERELIGNFGGKIFFHDSHYLKKKNKNKKKHVKKISCFKSNFTHNMHAPD